MPVHFDLTSEEGRKSFIKYADDFDHKIYLSKIKEERKRRRYLKNKKKIAADILKDSEFIKACENHSSKFDLCLFNKMFEERCGNRPTRKVDVGC